MQRQGNFIIYILITLTTLQTIRSDSLKTGERCLLQALNKSDYQLKYLSDYTNLNTSVLDFPLLTKELQKAYRDCGVNKDLKQKCEAFFYPNECEECGMIYVKKCPKDYRRIDCGLCAHICPEKTTTDAAGALCKKPQMLRKGIYRYMLDCKKNHLNEGCTQHENYITSNCPQFFTNVGNFMCSYKCPDNFVDKGIYCVPNIIENNQYFISDFVDSDDHEEDSVLSEV